MSQQNSLNDSKVSSSTSHPPLLFDENSSTNGLLNNFRVNQMLANNENMRYFTSYCANRNDILRYYILNSINGVDINAIFNYNVPQIHSPVLSNWVLYSLVCYYTVFEYST